MTSLLHDPWTVAEEDFPTHGAPSEKLKFLINYAVLAPSSHNTQPWLFRIIGDEIELYADRTRTLPVVDPRCRALIISCGAALFHLRIALRYYGYEPVVHAFPDLATTDLLARLRIGPPHTPSPLDDQLFSAILKRRTHRPAFQQHAVPPPVLTALAAAAHQEGAVLHLMQTPEQQQALAALIAEGDRQQAQDPDFRRELAAWIRPNRSPHRDGVPGYAMGRGTLTSYAAPFVVRSFDWGPSQAAHDQQLAEEAPALAVLATDGDTLFDWLAAGQALDRVLLQARAHGLCASFLNQPVEVDALRPQVAALTSHDGVPQLVLRLGYGDEAPTTPRRPAHEVIKANGASR